MFSLSSQIAEYLNKAGSFTLIGKSMSADTWTTIAIIGAEREILEWLTESGALV